MNESTKTKKALRGGLFALFLCIVLLIGTTFAWFTDTASTGVNKIQSGNLDVELQYSTDGGTTWTKADSNTKLFDDSALYEPGYTQVAYVKVKNAGNLALKYSLASECTSLSAGKNVYDVKYNLNDYLMMGAASTKTVYADRTAAREAVADNAAVIKRGVQLTGADMPVLKPGETSDIIALVVYMPETVGNEANPKSKSWNPKIQLGVILNATQASVESDSFNNTYDDNAPTHLKAISSSSETLNITGSYQAGGSVGVVQAEKTAHFTVDADVYAVYDQGGAIAVQADGNSTITINGGDFRQVDVPANDKSDLIYALGNATITINGGTFKATTPANTLNVNDNARGKARIIVNGGRFYKYDPSNPTLGDNEIFLGEGCKVTQDGDWYVVSK